jgi:hypothetical protein
MCISALPVCFLFSFFLSLFASNTTIFLLPVSATQCVMAPAPLREKTLKENQEKIFEVIGKLSVMADDIPEEGAKGYTGIQAIAKAVAEGVGTSCTMDQTLKLSTLFAAPAWSTLEAILDANNDLQDTSSFVRESAPTCRAGTCSALARMLPHTGTVRIPQAMSVVSRILLNDEMPASLKRNVQSTMSYICNINKGCMKHCGTEIMELVAGGGNDHLISVFLTVPEMYTNSPEGVHKHIDYMMTMNYPMVCSIFNNVAKRNPSALSPYINEFIEKLSEQSTMAGLTVGILAEIANDVPEKMFPRVEEIVSAVQGVQYVDHSLALLIGRCGKAKTPAKAADSMLLKLVEGLRNCTDNSMKPSWLNELNNICGSLSSKDLLTPHMALISSNKAIAEIIVKNIEDFAAGYVAANLKTVCLFYIFLIFSFLFRLFYVYFSFARTILPHSLSLSLSPSLSILCAMQPLSEGADGARGRHGGQDQRTQQQGGG